MIELVSKPSKLQLQLAITDDTIRFENSPTLPRPLHISRCRWRAFWTHIAFCGLKIELMDRFMRGERHDAPSAANDRRG